MRSKIILFRNYSLLSVNSNNIHDLLTRVNISEHLDKHLN